MFMFAIFKCNESFQVSKIVKKISILFISSIILTVGFALSILAAVCPDGKLKLSGSSLEVKKVLLQIGLLGLKLGDLSLELAILIFLVLVSLSHVLFGLDHIIC